MSSLFNDESQRLCTYQRQFTSVFSPAEPLTVAPQLSSPPVVVAEGGSGE